MSDFPLLKPCPFCVGQKVRVTNSAFQNPTGEISASWAWAVALRGQIVTVVDFNRVIVVAIDEAGEIWGLKYGEVEEIAQNPISEPTE